MKITVLFFVLFVSTIIGFSQSLEGEWKGYFKESNSVRNYRAEIIFQFSKIDDTTFKAISTTVYKIDKNQYDTAVCILTGGFYEKNILYLEETRVIKDFESTSACLQLMKLYYKKRKGYLILEGNWYMSDRTCEDDSGSIMLKKTL